MPLTRQQVYEIIDKERAYEDELWKPHPNQGNSEHTLCLVNSYYLKALAEWTKSSSEVLTWQQLAKIAAIIVRALEAGNETEELAKGLR